MNYRVHVQAGVSGRKGFFLDKKGVVYWIVEQGLIYGAFQKKA